MRPDQERAALDRLAEIHAAPKSFDSWPEWEVHQERSRAMLHYRVPLRLSGVLGGGVVAHLVTPQQAWDSNVYGQVEVPAIGGRSTWRVDPVEWKPDRPHRNPNDAPAEHRFKEVHDRIHPFDLNRRLGILVFAQARIGIAIEFPRAIAIFEDYLSLCAEVWNCPDMRDVPPPTWHRTLV